MKTKLKWHDVKKGFYHDLDKVISPDKTVKKVTESLKVINLDILSETKRIDTGRLDIPVYLSLCGADAKRTIGTAKQMGKGGSPDQAKASALMELVERFSFFHFIKNFPKKIATYSTLKNALDISYAAKALFDVPDDRNSKIFSRLSQKWVWGYKLDTLEEILIPVEWFYLINEYNGPASGNAMEEAALQALCEVIERHVGSIISYEKLDVPTIERESIKDPVSIELLSKFEKNGIQIVIKDFSLDTGIPTVGVLAWDPSTFPLRSEIIFTAGTTSNPYKSLNRALTEIAQLAGDFESLTSYVPTLPKYSSLKDTLYLTSSKRSVSIESLPNFENENIRIELEFAIEILKNKGLDCFMIDVTHPKLNIPAVYMIIPGAHFLDRTRDTSVIFHAARMAALLEDKEEALRQLEYMLEVYPDSYFIHYFLGVALEQKGEYELAIEHLNKSLKLEPKEIDLPSIYCYLGVCLKETGKYRKAIDILNRAAAFNTSQKEIFNLMGFCNYMLKQHKDAIMAFEKAIKIDPGSAIDYANIGSNLRELGNIPEAIKMYRMALEFDPDIDFARDNIERLTKQLKGETGIDF